VSYNARERDNTHLQKRFSNPCPAVPKDELIGRKVLVTEESYTNECGFLD
jgi:hypothetical protein